MDLKSTPLLEAHKKLAAKLAPFGGWLMPIQYSGIIAEHNWTRHSASLFDICHMGEFMIYAEPKKSNLEGIFTINLRAMPCGKCSYGFMLNAQGGIIDDSVVYRIEPEKWMVVVNAATTHKDEDNLKKNLLPNARLENLSSQLGKVDLQGPFSSLVLKDLLGTSLEKLKYYHFTVLDILGEKNILSRSGYTGELGYELYLSNEKIPALWDWLLKDNRVKPAGLGARDTLRLEMGYPLYGQDISEEVTPLEAGLERFVDFNKDFIGRSALLEQKKRGINKTLAGLVTDSRRAARHNYKIYSGSKEIGRVTSGSFSPSLGCGIGMGYVEPDYNKIGTRLTLKAKDIAINATIAAKPFYTKGTVKSYQLKDNLFSV